jgi:hypothetical protein
MNSRTRSQGMVETLEAMKASLLPIPKIFVDSLSLRYHMALEVMRIGVGSSLHLETLVKVVALAGFLADDGYGMITRDDRIAAQEAARVALCHGQKLGQWFLDAEAFDNIARVVTLHDEQLRIAPFVAISTAGKKLDQFMSE